MNSNIKRGVGAWLALCVMGALAWMVLGASAQAASFDCAKAQSEVEKLICADAELSRLDEEMAAAYRHSQSLAGDIDEISKIQKLWLSARNLCPDATCVRDIYVKRLSALRPNVSMDARQQPSTRPPVAAPSTGNRKEPAMPEQRDAALPCMSVDECRINPVRMETLGANWQYKRDADKLPVIRNALASGKLKAPADELSGKNAAFCSAFKEDFLNGRNVRAIEPDYEVLSVDDPRLEPWMNPKDCPDNDDVAPYSKWLSLGLYGVPPYRFYRLEIDSDRKNGKEDVVLFREAGNGYSQRYQWVDLKQCLIKESYQVSSPQDNQNMGHRDALGLLISYQGGAMVLRHTDWAKKNESETNGSRVFLAGFNGPRVCSWSESFKSSSN